MIVCTYDNPDTGQRECWQDGKLLCSYSVLVLSGISRNPIPGPLFFFGANIGPWKLGQIVGDAQAMRHD